MPIIFVTTLLLLLTPLARGQSSSHFNLMPTPSSVQLRTGKLPIKRSFSVAISGHRDGILERGVQRFIGEISHETGMRLNQTTAEKDGAILLIRADHGSESVGKVGEDESYELTVGTSNARLTAPNPLGILHGLQTFLQLIETGTDAFSVPVMTIKDKPFTHTASLTSREFIGRLKQR